MRTSRDLLFESIRELWNIAAELKDRPGFREIAADTAARSSELWTRVLQLDYRPSDGVDKPVNKAQAVLAHQRRLTRDFAAKEQWKMYDLAATLEARYVEIVQAMESLQACHSETRRLIEKGGPQATDAPQGPTGSVQL